VDAYIHECMNQLTQNNPERLSLINILFYADDGAIMGENPHEVQLLLDLFTSTFARVGLMMNADKTECMIMNRGKVTQPMLSQAYEQKITEIGMRCQEIDLEKATCDQCRTQVCRKQLQ
jgi:Reverse transcriptase (RNA-dependent DNA polymerase)